MLLEMISQKYYFDVYQSFAVDGGYIIQTDCGTKFVSIWDHEADVQWSFKWREILVQQGFRQVDRFIRTKDLTPYVFLNEKYVVIQDVCKGKFINLNQPVTWEKIGTFTGKLFRIFADPQLQKESIYHIKKLSRQKYEPFVTIDLPAMKRALVLRDTPFSALAYSQFSSLERRFKQAKWLYQMSSAHTPFILTLPSINLYNWQVLKVGSLHYHSKEQSQIIGYEALARLLQTLYTKGVGSLEHLDRFYEAFKQEYSFSVSVGYHILAHLIVPIPFIRLLQSFIQETLTDEECMDRWVHLCEQQVKGDQVHLWFAECIDRQRQESVSV